MSGSTDSRATEPWAWPEGVARHVLPEVDSTNAEAARLAPYLTQPTWILALRQTAARARRGRSWQNTPGNFAATLLMRPGGSPQEAALRSFVAALAVHEALGSLAGPSASLALKWPNDVLLNGGKVSGILLESLGSSGHGVSHLAIGIGVNLAAAPDPAGIEPTTAPPVSVAGETGMAPGPEEFLTCLAAAFARWEAQLATFGFGPIRTAWLARAARLGQTITARTMTESIEGRFETIDDTGALVLVTAQGRRAVPAADVYF
ncbi:biotin--[acetyl-CoA-carboxylase] ligase [Frigidibacter mobilis]|uniref:biotin--[biotin carboxyl-carrier protein] ligase n=1 Tax=Frigidibacter mobilis TaxID=1335048 RepID=A0A159Z2Y7_9RHOB|nr:biotin--[acetyl-CoA-carboxylase] ligase [Frigidibacter mobilis]AMY69467.1 biotin--acetyl-CoA-carboxylase ligase [Frigidibacter mobilis]